VPAIPAVTQPQNATDPVAAMQQATSGSDAIAQQNAQNTQRAQASFGVNAPGHAWQVGADGYGQGQVQHIRTTDNVSPVAEMKLPVGAIASRQQAIYQKKQELDAAKRKLLEAFDPFKSIDKAADPHATAFDNYTRDTFNAKTQELLSTRFGGNEDDMYNWLATDPAGQVWMDNNFTHPVNSVAQESRGLHKQAVDFMTKVAEGKYEPLDPDTMQSLNEYTQGVDKYGAPMRGKDPTEFSEKGRKVSTAMWREKYFNDIVLPELDKLAVNLPPEVGAVEKLGGGRYRMTIKNEVAFDHLIAPHAESLVNGGTFPDMESATAYLKQKIKNRVTFEEKQWDAPRPTGGGGEQKQKSWAASTSRPPYGPFANQEFNSIQLTDITGGKGNTAAARLFDNEGGSGVYGHPVEIIDINGAPYIHLKMTGEPKTKNVKDTGGGTGAMDLNLVEEDPAEEQPVASEYEDFSKLKSLMVPYNKNNAARIQNYFGLSEAEVNKTFGRDKQTKAKVPVPANLQKDFSPEEWNTLDDATRNALMQ
jgi:hypothetical protein